MNKHYFEYIVEAAPNAIILVGLDGKITYVNSQTEKLFKYARVELIGQGIEVLIPKRYRNHHVGLRDGFIQSPSIRPMSASRDLFGMRKDESEFPLEIGLNPIESPNGKVILASVIDITERKKHEVMQLEYEHLFMNSNDLSCVANLSGYFEIVNPRFNTLLGYNNKELLGVQFIDFIHPEDVEATLKEIAKLETGLDTINFINRYRKKDGDYLWFEWNSTSNKEHNKIYAIARDVTERVKHDQHLEAKQQELEAKNRELEQFNYIASHDLQEPLRTISNYANLLESKYLKEEKEEIEFIHSIQESTIRMQKLIKGLLYYSRLGKNKKKIKVDTQLVVLDVLADMEVIINSENARIEVGPLPKLDGYEIEIRQLFQNLVSNALKFKKKGVAPIIKISSLQTDNGIEFAIEDNGIGINIKNHERVFNIFQRLHTYEEYEGNGIGLANCRKIVQMHHGQIWIKSEINEGTTFYFTLNNS